MQIIESQTKNANQRHKDATLALSRLLPRCPVEIFSDFDKRREQYAQYRIDCRRLSGEERRQMKNALTGFAQFDGTWEDGTLVFTFHRRHSDAVLRKQGQRPPAESGPFETARRVFTDFTAFALEAAQGIFRDEDGHRLDVDLPMRHDSDTHCLDAFDHPGERYAFNTSPPRLLSRSPEHTRPVVWKH